MSTSCSTIWIGPIAFSRTINIGEWKNVPVVKTRTDAARPRGRLSVNDVLYAQQGRLTVVRAKRARRYRRHEKQNARSAHPTPT